MLTKNGAWKTDFQNGPTQRSGLLSRFEMVIPPFEMIIAYSPKGLAKVFRMAGESCIADTKTAHSM